MHPRECEPQRILIVENDHDTGQMLDDLLSMHGYAVVVLGIGQHAITYLKRCSPRPDVLVLDFDLPDMTGRDVLAATVDVRTDLPVVLMTAHQDGLMLARALDVPRYLAKPFAPQDLLMMVQGCTDVTRARAVGH